jgi:DNA-binding NtrC family response regulator
VGAGLGLATVAGTVRSAGGTIDLESTPGVGTTVRVCLPRLAVEPLASEASGGKDSPRGRGETILVVDDEVEVGRAVASALEDAGYRTLVAGGPDQALALTASAGPSVALLVTDVVMQGLSGPDLASRLRERRPGLPVVFMTGHADRSADLGALLRSGDSLLRKPFAIAELIERVEDELGSAGRSTVDDAAKLHS